MSGTGVTLEIAGGPQDLEVVELSGWERVHEVFLFRVTFRSGQPLDAETVLGGRAQIVFPQQDAPRHVIGVVERVEAHERGTTVEIVPRVARLRDVIDHRVFLHQDAVSIVRAIAEEHGIDLDVTVTRRLDERAQCVQSFESSLDFCCRILAEEGILFFVDCGTGKDVVRIVDHASGHQSIAGEEALTFSDTQQSGLERGDTAYQLALAHRRVVDRLTLSAYDFERPDVDLVQHSGSGPIGHYEHTAAVRSRQWSKELGNIRLEELRARRITMRGKSTSRRLAPGATFRIEEAPREDMNGRWLLLEVEHRFVAIADTAGRAYEASFVAVPAEQTFRPARPTAPRVSGVRTATVTGAGGSEIHTEKHGRMTAHLRWDRRTKKDDTSSAWLRSVQPPTSGGMFLPRVGWEVLLAHEGTSADEPYAIGRMAHAAHPPPETLPAKKVRSAFGSRTTPGGGSGNTLVMDDAAGSEGMSIGASGDFNEKTENDKGTVVKGGETIAVGANHTESVGIVEGVTVDGAQSYTIGGSRKMTTTGDLRIAAASEAITVGGSRNVQVGGDYETKASSATRVVGVMKMENAIQEVNRHVTGAATMAVGGPWIEIAGAHASISVLGANTLAVSGPRAIQASGYSLVANSLGETYASLSVSAGGDRIEHYKGVAKLAVGTSLEMAGSDVLFKATSKISIKASGVTISITPGGIDIKGKFDGNAETIVTGDEEND